MRNLWLQNVMPCVSSCGHARPFERALLCSPDGECLVIALSWVSVLISKVLVNSAHAL